MNKTQKGSGPGYLGLPASSIYPLTPPESPVGQELTVGPGPGAAILPTPTLHSRPPLLGQKPTLSPSHTGSQRGALPHTASYAQQRRSAPSVSGPLPFTNSRLPSSYLPTHNFSLRRHTATTAATSTPNDNNVASGDESVHAQPLPPGFYTIGAQTLMNALNERVSQSACAKNEPATTLAKAKPRPPSLNTIQPSPPNHTSQTPSSNAPSTVTETATTDRMENGSQGKPAKRTDGAAGAEDKMSTNRKGKTGNTGSNTSPVRSANTPTRAMSPGGCSSLGCSSCSDTEPDSTPPGSRPLSTDGSGTLDVSVGDVEGGEGEGGNEGGRRRHSLDAINFSQDWVYDVPSFMRRARLHKYTPELVKHDVTFERLLRMTNEDLLAVGIVTKGARTRMLQFISKYNRYMTELEGSPLGFSSDGLSACGTPSSIDSPLSDASIASPIPTRLGATSEKRVGPRRSSAPTTANAWVTPSLGVAFAMHLVAKEAGADLDSMATLTEEEDVGHFRLDAKIEDEGEKLLDLIDVQDVPDTNTETTQITEGGDELTAPGHTRTGSSSLPQSRSNSVGLATPRHSRRRSPTGSLFHWGSLELLHFAGSGSERSSEGGSAPDSRRSSFEPIGSPSGSRRSSGNTVGSEHGGSGNFRRQSSLVPAQYRSQGGGDEGNSPAHTMAPSNVAQWLESNRRWSGINTVSSVPT